MNIFRILIPLLLTSCALPAPEFENQSFVPKKEVVVNFLYQEGTALYKAGRFIDAELKLRQAIYIYPEAENLRSNLALILKSNGLYEESNEIYLELIEKFPEAYDYKYALAESYLRQKRFKEAAVLFNQAMLDYEKVPEINKAANAARSLASLYFLQGEEREAFCSSLEAFSYLPDDTQRIRHVKLLLAAGYYQKANDEILPLIANPSDIKDLAILKLASLVFFGINDIEQTKKFMNLAKENQTAAIKEFDAELEKIRELIEYKYPEPPDPNAEDEADVEEEDKPQLIFSEQSLLYWPAALVEIYYEFEQSQLEEAAN